MTLSDLVREIVAEHFEGDFVNEHVLGDANRADFRGNCPWLGEVRVELERRREDPVNNVVKAWRQASGNEAEKPFTLVQVFSGYYLQRPAKRRNAEFVGGRMCEWAALTGKTLRYISVSFDFEPMAGQAGFELALNVADGIRGQLRAAPEQAMPRPASFNHRKGSSPA